MKIVKQILVALSALTLIVASIGMASSTVRAASPFTCGQTSRDTNPSLPGTVQCEAGEDYIRWTFSGLQSTTFNFGYGYTASQAGWAELRTNIQYTKKMWGSDKAKGHNYVWVAYGDIVTTAPNYDFVTRVLPFGPGNGAGVDETAPYAVDWGATYSVEDNTTRLMENFQPGSGKTFSIIRHEQLAGTPPEDQMGGSVEIRLVGQGQSSLASTSPFYCSAQWPGGGYRSNNSHEVSFWDAYPGAGENRPLYSKLPDGITCEEGSNYIKWTFEKQSPIMFVFFGNVPELAGQAVHVTASYKRYGFYGGIFGGNNRSMRFFVERVVDTGNFYWPISAQPVEDGYVTYTFEEEYEGTLSGTAQRMGFDVEMGDYMGLSNLGTTPWHDNVSGYVMITAPNYVNTAATATAAAGADLTATAQADLTATAQADLTATAQADLTATAGADLTATAMYDLTATAGADLTATALAVTATPTSSGGGGGGGGGGDDPGGGGGDDPPPNPPTVTPVPTWTATPTRTTTATVTATLTGTPTRTATPGPSQTTTSTPNGGGATATKTATSGPSQTATSTAIGGGSSTATATLSSGEVIALTQTAIAPIIWTMTAVSNPNTNPNTNPLNGGTGSSTSPFGTSGTAVAPANSNANTGSASAAYSGPCAGYLRVLAYVDTNEDNIMARQGEGVEGVAVSLTDADYNIITELGMENGVVKFCIPERLAGQMVYVDIPYLLRSGSVQAPRMQSQQSSNNPFGNSASVAESKLQTLELFFKLDAPILPLSLP